MYAWHWAGCCPLSEYDQCSARASLGPDHQGAGPCGQPLPPGRPGTGAAGRGQRAQLLEGTVGASAQGAAAWQKLSLRRKKALSAEKMELEGPGSAPGGQGSPARRLSLPGPWWGGPAEVEHGPLAVFQMCASQRLASEPQDSAAVSLLTSSVGRGRDGVNKGSTSLGGAVARLECSDRKGSSQGTPRQPSTTRLPTWGRPGKSPMRGST
uniref:Uncharacterized protein n=1 Tax=Theropithecus gelada TaxID=9565 RepID=A0A8D2ELH6_THEGE